MFAKVIESEIEWCEKNKGIAPDEFRKGFIAGLKQAVYLINAAKQRMVWRDGEMVDDDDLLDRDAEQRNEAVLPQHSEACDADTHAFLRDKAGHEYCHKCGERLRS